MLKNIEEDFWDPSVTKEQTMDKIEKRYKFIDFIVTSHASTGCFTSFLTSLFPTGRYPEGIKQLPGICWFPFNSNPYPIHQIAWIILLWNNFMGFYSHVAYDFLFIYFAEHLCSQFIILQEVLESVATLKSSSGEEIHNYKKLIHQLEICIRHHNLLIR